jgi:hypothetical protein
MKRILVLLIALVTYQCVAQNHRIHVLAETDTLNKHFVRFLCMTDLKLGNPSISISADQIPPLSVVNEPVVTQIYCTEKNERVSTKTYIKIKNYILKHKCELIGDKSEQDKYGFLLIIDVDFKHRYFIQAEKTKAFLTKLEKYLERDGIANQIKGITTIEYLAEHQISTYGMQPPEPN